jgi:hypothetical protein
MKMNSYSPTYMALLDLLFKTQTMKMANVQITQNGGRFERVSTSTESDRLQQDFYVAASELWAQCTPHEWHLIGRISSELKKFNALWQCESKLKNNSSIRKSIQGLLKMKVLIKTETTDIYLVNPYFVRRGDFCSVLNTTAECLMNTTKVTTDHIKNCNPVKKLDLGNDQKLLLD